MLTEQEVETSQHSFVGMAPYNCRHLQWKIIYLNIHINYYQSEETQNKLGDLWRGKLVSAVILMLSKHLFGF